MNLHLGYSEKIGGDLGIVVLLGREPSFIYKRFTYIRKDNPSAMVV